MLRHDRGSSLAEILKSLRNRGEIASNPQQNRGEIASNCIDSGRWPKNVAWPWFPPVAPSARSAGETDSAYAFCFLAERDTL
jgi:hypothetical protein